MYAENFSRHCTQALTLTNWLLKYGLHDRNGLTTMQTIHTNAHTNMAYSITVFLQNQDNGFEKYNAVTQNICADLDSYS